MKASEAWGQSITSTVANQAFYISGNGGRKITRLSNGWLIAVVFHSSGLYWYKSTNNGVNWTEMFHNTSNWSSGSFGICSYGTWVYTIGTLPSASGVGAYLWKFDANEQVSLPGAANLPGNESSFGTGCSITADSNGTIHATWCSKNSTYPNSFNIRYSKLMNGEGTWATPTQITSYNTTNYDATSPSIVIKSDNNPLIVFSEKSQFSIYYIVPKWWNGSTWATTASTYLYSDSTYAQINPCATVSPDGTIHVVWLGKDPIDTTVWNVRYNKSTDGGVNWGTVTKLTSGNLYHQDNPSICSDKNNYIYVMFTGIHSGSTTYYQLRQIVYSSGSWGTISNLTNATNTQAQAQTCDNYKDFTEPLCIWQDNQTNSIKYSGLILTTKTSIISPSQNSTLFQSLKTSQRSV